MRSSMPYAFSCIFLGVISDIPWGFRGYKLSLPYLITLLPVLKIETSSFELD